MIFYDRLAEAVGADSLQCQEPMSEHTTFRIGGKADYFVRPKDRDALTKGIKLCTEAGVPWFVTGNGSNLLVGDGGYRGVIFCLCRTMDDVSFCEQESKLTVTAGAGCLLSRLAREVALHRGTGFEYATGIPGTLGGAVTMNAGAYGGEIADNICWAEVMDKNGDVLRLERDELELFYRHSIIMEKNYIVLSACLAFDYGEDTDIQQKIATLSTSRKEKQPLEYPSAGSTFKRPTGYFAGKLIQDCGLKGYRVGDAMVSEKHAGFVINVGHATAKDVMTLIEHVQARVREEFDVELETEVRILGEFDA